MESTVAKRHYFDRNQYCPVKVKSKEVEGFTVGYLKDISASGCAIRVPKTRSQDKYSDLLFVDDARTLCHKVEVLPKEIVDYRKQDLNQCLELSMAPLRIQNISAESKVVYVLEEEDHYIYGLEFQSLEQQIAQELELEVEGASKRSKTTGSNLLQSKTLKLMWLVISFTSIVTVSKILQRFL